MFLGHLASFRLLQCAAIMMVISFANAWQDFTTCGKWPIGSIKIVDGEPSNVGEWPWMVAFWRNDPRTADGRRGCGASLIHKEWILTAAHCVGVLNEPPLYYHVMGTNTTVVEEFPDSVQIIGVSEVYMHPNYTTWRAATTDWDIAVMKLKEPAQLSQLVYPVCLPRADMGEDSAFPPGSDATITGWGSTVQGGAQNPDLHKVTVPIVSQTECQEYYADELISERMVCAGIEKGGKDSCQGDSGGPMVAKPTTEEDDLQTRWFQPGVVSWGYGCAQPEYPGVYTRVSVFQEWLMPIFDNDSRPMEKYGDNDCMMDEFTCKGLLCIEHASRCDGTSNCYYKHDEYECGTSAKYFDPMPGKKLKQRGANIYEKSQEECAQQCLDRKDCFAFDTVKDGDRYKCYLAEDRDIEIENTGPNDNEMHYELLKPAEYGVKELSYDQRHNFLVTPRWMLKQDTNISSWFIWDIQPALAASGYNSIVLNFAGIQSMAAEEECTTADKMNMVIIRSGVGVSSPVSAAYCLHELPSTFTVMSQVARVEFYSMDSAAYGFLGEYSAVLYCDTKHTTSPGTVTSPNYPSNYPPRAQCSNLIQAPEGIKIELNFTQVLLEESPKGNCYDNLMLYDGPDSESLKLADYCTNGSDIFNLTWTSTSNSFFIVFTSDTSGQDTGYEASYRFLTGRTREEMLETSLNRFKYGMTAMGIFFFCLTMVFIVSVITITGRENAEREKIQKLKYRQSIGEMIPAKVINDNIDWDKPSTSQAGSSGSSGSQAQTPADNFGEVNEVEGKTNPAYDKIE